VRRCVTLSLAALALSVGAPARAAVLDGIQGQVLINRGAGYRLAKGPTELKPGDSIIANPGGSAVVSYTDGCNVPVAAGSVVAVADASPCNADLNHSFKPPARATDGPKPFALGGIDGTTLGVGALVVGGVVGVAALIGGGGDKDQPASP
jgi:hypothetical protein